MCNKNGFDDNIFPKKSFIQIITKFSETLKERPKNISYPLHVLGDLIEEQIVIKLGRILQNLAKSSNIWPNYQKLGKITKNLSKLPKSWKYHQRFGKITKDLAKSPKVWQNYQI